MDILTLIKTNPEEARAALLLTFSEAGALSSRAAALYHVHPSTFSRWVAALDLGPVLVQRRLEAKREGWAAKDDRGKRGPDQAKRVSRREADARRKKKRKSKRTA